MAKRARLHHGLHQEQDCVDGRSLAVEPMHVTATSGRSVRILRNRRSSSTSLRSACCSTGSSSARCSRSILLQPIFLIWYASLDCETTIKKDGTVHKSIDPELVTAVAGELQSFAGLSKRVKDVDKSLGDRIHAIEREQTYYRVIAAIAVAVVVALSVGWLKDAIGTKVQAPPAASAPASRQP
jgi:hypothetical protein